MICQNVPTKIDLYTLSGLEKVKFSTRWLLKEFPIARCKTFVRSLCKTAEADSRHKLSSQVFRHPCFDQFFHQRGRQRIIGRETNGPLGDLKTFQITPKFFQRRGTARIERAVIGPCAEENQRTPIQAKCRNSIADALFCPRSDRMDSLAKFLEHDSLLGAYACQVFVNCSRLKDHFSAYASFSV